MRPSKKYVSAKRKKFKLQPLSKDYQKLIALNDDEMYLDSFKNESVMTEYRNKTTTGDVTD